MRRAILKSKKEWKEKYGKYESEFRRMFDNDLEGILRNPSDYKCKLIIWVRYVGNVQYYDFQFRSPYRKLNTLRKEANQWLKLSVRTLGDTPLDEGVKTAEQIWTDLQYVLRDYPGKRDLQMTLEDPVIEQTAIDARFDINGINPEINYNAITINQIKDALADKFGWEPPRRRMKKQEMVEIWMEAVDTDGKSLDLEEDILNE